MTIIIFGIGTTAAGLRAGKPTWICPFFGDQNFWGEMVSRRGVGPKPCPVGLLSLDNVVSSLTSLLDSSTFEKTLGLSHILQQEDGVEGAREIFYRRLPLDKMLCDVSVFMGESRLAHVMFFTIICGLFFVFLFSISSFMWY